MSDYVKLVDQTTGQEYTLQIDIQRKVVKLSLPDQPKPVTVMLYIEDRRLNVETSYPNCGEFEDMYGLSSAENLTVEKPKTLDVY